MSAGVVIEVGHGPVGSIDWAVVASKIRFKLADDDAVDINDPLMVLNVSTLINGAMTLNTLSYIKTFRINVIAAAQEELSNLRFFRSAGGNTGINEKYGFTTVYIQAVGNSEGNNLSGASSAIAVVSMATVPVLVVNGSGPFVGTGEWGDMVVIQWQITPSVVGLGVVPADVVYTFRYDEI